MNSYWKSDRITLRAMEHSDISLFEGLDDDVSRNVDAVHFPQSRGRQAAWVESEIERLKQPVNDKYRWIADNEDGVAVGTIDTFACDRRNGTFKYGIALSKEFWGRGYAKEMIILVLKYYFLELGYQKATPHVYSFNERSIKLHEKIGFKREGQLRNMILSGGEYHDEIYFGMTMQEFIQLYKEGRI